MPNIFVPPKEMEMVAYLEVDLVKMPCSGGTVTLLFA